MADETKKYLDLNGLQSFYDKLKNKLNSGDYAYADSAFSLDSEKPIQNKIISQYIAMNSQNFGELSSYATSGYAASAWVQEHFDGYLDNDWTYSDDQKTISEALNNLNSRLESVETSISDIEPSIPIDISFNTLTAFSAYITATSSTNISSNNVTANNLSSTNLTALTANGNSAKYTNISSTNLTSENITTTGISATTITGNLSGLAGSATKLSTDRDISITGNEIAWTVNFDGSQNVAASGQIKKIENWSAIEHFTANSASTNNTGIMTPDQIQAAIQNKVDIAIGGVYQIQGNASWEEITSAGSSAQHNGYVYNITGTTTTADKDIHGNEVHPGDNVVYVSADGGWDVLANTMEMTAKLDTTAFNAWSSSTSSNFSGISNSSITVTDYVGNQTVSNVIGSANSGLNAYNWLTANSKNIVSSVTTATGYNVTLTTTTTTATSGSSVEFKADGYKTTFTTGDYISGTSADSNHTFNYNLTDTAVNYLEQGHSAWSAVSSLINGDELSAKIVKASSGFSGVNISGETYTSTIDNLISSAISGADASVWISNTANYYYSGNFIPYTTAEVVTGINW